MLSLLVIIGGDTLALVAATAVGEPRTVLVVGLVAMVVWGSRGLYGRRFTLSVIDDVPAILLGVLAGIAVLALISNGSLPLRGAGLETWLASVVVARAVAYRWVTSRRRRGREVFPALLVGRGARADMLAERIRQHPETGLRLVQRRSMTTFRRTPTADDIGELRRAAARHDVSDVFICGHQGMLGELVDELRRWRTTETAVHVVPGLFEFHLLGRGAGEVWGVPLETVRRPGHHWTARAVKRSMDVALSATALLVLSPVILVVALAVRIEVGPSIIYRQVRVGRSGRTFSLLKFRSVPPTVKAETQWSVVDRSVLGVVGRFIRRFSLDELPQLFNVLKGDMSLVGPRPERPEYVDSFEDQVEGYRHRHRAPVGLTGLAAVKGLRGNSSLHERVYFDNLYIENWSIWLDVKILLRTVVSVLRGTGS
ncbi:sugar transferase [Nocardioides sp. CER19]|uniref:sugar transferase n=1 Tax=Nocardioides sp. CER19 TaxID=3038538 RepID=UPI002449E33B|nr:sugar transferase [Nocardioides sp. CER19]MDH2414172.1 sugar transferase [Nocardioides sp. CER19]